jgi:leucyl aminopeptidase
MLLGGKRNHFDTGGLNIKTAGMVHMKVPLELCNLLLICNRKSHRYVPCAENAVDAKAFCQAI